ncbi:MAG: transferrin-binding protein-like solute binding protein [Boseongicola sp. SB0670_bin_30]|nr:transferrin-binding protein-like solute binding protein [Boseongicola sp. SB0670_bin_30]
MKFPCALGWALASGLSLAACGESGVQSALSPNDIRELTGLSVPAETGTEQLQRQQGIFSRANSLILSTTHDELTTPEGTRSVRKLSECSGPRCEQLEPVTGESQSIHLDEMVVASGDAESIGSAHGITLIAERTQHLILDGTSFGAWMEHGAFLLRTDQLIGEEIEFNSVYAIALGDLTGQPLSGSATWLGIMIGTPIVGDGKGDRLVGTAALNYDMTVGGLDAAFSSIWNVDRGSAYPVEALIFSNIAVGPDGTFATGQSGTRIQGSFHGAGHAEAAGVFEQSGVVGAFGATRQ